MGLLSIFGSLRRISVRIIFRVYLCLKNRNLVDLILPSSLSDCPVREGQYRWAGQSGVFLDAQEERIKVICQAKDWELVRVIRDESHSTKSIYRPGIMQIVSGCKKKEFEVVADRENKISLKQLNS
jgi:hypothetical protein